jgi:hypothetical protein
VAQGEERRKGFGWRGVRVLGWRGEARGETQGEQWRKGFGMELLSERGERREMGLDAVGKELFQNKNQFTAA